MKIRDEWVGVIVALDSIIDDVENGLSDMDTIGYDLDDVREWISDLLKEARIPVEYTEQLLRSMLGEHKRLAMSDGEGWI